MFKKMRTVNFITTDYDEAIKLRDKKVKEEIFNVINLFIPLEPIELIMIDIVNIWRKLKNINKDLMKQNQKHKLKEK